MSKSNIMRLVTPVGVGKYVFINEPQTKFDPNGIYNLTLVMSEADAKPLMEKLDEQIVVAREQALETCKPQKRDSLALNKPYAKEFDESGVETGNVEFKFKMSAKYTTRDGEVRERKPTIVDSQRQTCTDVVGSGSKLKVAFNARPYYMPSANAYGVSCFLSAVQVIELNGVDVADFAVEEGFVSSGIAEEKIEAVENAPDDF
ncbi:MAG: hypothetical protein CBB97_25455 [Candidatus Endolissoclinum sp. TMED37]|nr:MAG: hypothetical protein CBB97_25455 [Candidatus Endolissoclinum sp. TMED37]